MNYHFKEYDTENNQEITFENLKKSLLKENELFTRKEIEIILYDDASPDNSFNIMKELQEEDPRIKLYKNENKGDMK